MEEYLLCEPREKYPERQKVLERLLHCIWSEQLFRKTLQVEGKTLAISSPGWWNLEAGPDFRNAELFVDGERICGDVEIHLFSGDWYRHRHHEDPRYDRVAIHVVLYSDGRPCIKHNGERVPELEMKDHLIEELQLLQKRVPIHQFPFGTESNVRLCRRFLEEQDEEAVAKILDSAGDVRMRRKKDRFLEEMRDSGFEQAFFQGTMEGMGYKQSRYAFRELARRVPLAELLQFDIPGRRGIDSMAAVLLGTAGLLRDLAQVQMQPSDPETRHYVDELFQCWGRVKDRFAPRELTGFCWYPSSTRPANFPARRLTAVAAFLHYHGAQILPLLLQPLNIPMAGRASLPAPPASTSFLADTEARPPDFCQRKALRSVLSRWQELFAKPLHLYWSYHFQFERHKFTAPKRLIGRERSRILTINVVLPALLAHAELVGDRRLEELLHILYRTHPRLCDNSITRLMEHRLFGDRKRARKWIGTAHRQQALHHFFYDFCDNSETSCSRCELGVKKEDGR